MTYFSPAGVDKEAVLQAVVELFAPLFDFDFEGDGRSMELAVVEAGFAAVCLVLSAVFAQWRHRKALREIQDRGLVLGETAKFRLDVSYQRVAASVCGEVIFPLYAYRVIDGGTSCTRCPPCQLLPPKCKSTEALLRLEATIGSEVAFRKAQSLLTLVTHGAVKVHDSTIAKHCGVLAGAVGREWLYEKPSRIREILLERATRDEDNGRPLVFFSSDGHAERLYQDETFKRGWNMVNGLRIWAIDKDTGRAIHLGGEFVVGDCNDIAAVFEELNRLGILPFDGYWGEVQAQLVFVADGMPWFEDHIRAKFTADLGVVLDAFHVLERVAKTLKHIAKKKTKKYKKLLNQITKIVTGRPRSQTSSGSKKLRSSARKGVQKPPPAKRKYEAVDDKLSQRAEELELAADSAARLIIAIGDIELSKSERKHAKQLKHIKKLLNYLTTRVTQIRYAEAWARGWVLGSGAMESFNRIGQARLKLPGATWTPQMAQAMLNLKLLHTAGRAEEFWTGTGSTERVHQAFQEAA